MNLLDLYQHGVRVIRVLCFAFDVPGRRVLLQRRLWPSWERSTYGGGDEATYVLSGIEGRIPLVSEAGTGLCVTQLFQEFTGLVVPAAAWRLVTMSDLSPRVPAPIPLPPEHPSPLVVFATACDPPMLIDGAQALQGDVMAPASIDQVLLGQSQALLDPLPPLLATAFQAVGG